LVRVPINTRVAASESAVFERFVPPAAMLLRVSAMVTQCGIGSVIRALTHALPLVCPHLAPISVTMWRVGAGRGIRGSIELLAVILQAA